MKPFAYITFIGTRDKLLGPVPDLVALKRLIVESGEGPLFVSVDACYPDGTRQPLDKEIYLKQRADVDKLRQEAEDAIAKRNNSVKEQEAMMEAKGIKGRTSISRIYGMFTMGSYDDPHDVQIAHYMEHYTWIWKDDDELSIMGTKYGQ